MTTDTELLDLGVHLGILEHKIRSIRTNISNDINLAAFEMLKIWQNERQRYTLEQNKGDLKKALMKAGIPT